jgi:hypothetical protein
MFNEVTGGYRAGAVENGLGRSNRLRSSALRLPRNPACALAFLFAKPSVSSSPERPGLVPQLVFKTSTAS